MPYMVGNRYYRKLYGAKMAADRQDRPVWYKRKRIYEPNPLEVVKEAIRVARD